MVLAEPGPSETTTDAARFEVLSAAADCFMERGYAATSIDDVARRVGATKGRIYHHFQSKADLFAQIFRTGMDMNFDAIRPMTALEGRAVDVWRRMAVVHVGQMIRTKSFQRTVWEGVEMHLRGSTTPEQRNLFSDLVDYRSRYGNMFRAVIQRARAEGDMAFDDPSIANQLMFMSLNSPIFWYTPRPGETDEQVDNIVRQIVAFTLQGLGGKVERDHG